MLQKVSIFCGGPSSEHEVSILSASKIFELIDKKKYNVSLLYIGRNLSCEFLKDTTSIPKFPKIPLLEALTTLKATKSFCLLAGVHGEFVEDGKIQTLLEFFKIPYSGTGPEACALAMDKYRSSLVVGSLSGVVIPSTNFYDQTTDKLFQFPVVIKPNTLGSSVGVSIVHTKKELDKAIKNLKANFPDQQILAQEYLEDAIEIQCGALQKKNGDFIALPPIEIIPKKNVFFDYDSKYLSGGATEITPPVSISKKLSDKISILSIEIHKLLALKTYSRTDFMVKNGKIYFLETNTLPGMTATSLLPQEANSIGISYPQLLDFIISNS
jgi:D-alanine-D-alanine ligase